MKGGGAQANRRALRAEWTAQRVAWAVLAALLLAALLGVFGGGPLARAEARGADGLAVRYERFSRARCPETLTVLLPADAGGGRTLRISAALLDGVRLLDVSPPPARVRWNGEERVFVFDAEPGADGPLRIAFRLEPTRAGRLVGWMAAGAGAPVEIGKLVHP
jgi:hypothetical protein